MKVIDIHTHLELHLPGVPQDPQRKRPPRLFMKLYEKMGYSTPLWRSGNYPEPIRILISLDNQLRLSMASAENLLAYMDRSGVSVSVAMPIAPFVSSQLYLDKVAGNPRLLAFAGAHPDDTAWPANLRAAMVGGCRGLKIHPIAQQLEPSCEFYFNLLEEFRAYGKPVLTHTGTFDYFIPRSPCAAYGSPERFRKLISSFPDVPFILGHMGIHEREAAIALALKYDNVYLETSFQSAAVIRRAVRQVGRERVLFGSDWPESEQLIPLKMARRAAGRDSDLAERLLWKNAEALIGPVD
ncbi:MAG: amidohydrolase family protein [Bacillota bacterium]